MEFVPGFTMLLQGLAATMTTPTFENFVTILAAGDSASKHYSSYHRLFSAARWSLDAVGLVVFDLIEPFLGEVLTTRWRANAA